MPKFNVSVSHSLAQTEAVEKLKDFSQQVRQDSPVELSDVNEVWDDQGNLEFSFKAMGMTVSGSMVASSQDVVVNGKLPFAALPFRGQIEKQIETQIKSALG